MKSNDVLRKGAFGVRGQISSYVTFLYDTELSQVTLTSTHSLTERSTSPHRATICIFPARLAMHRFRP